MPEVGGEGRRVGVDPVLADFVLALSRGSETAPSPFQTTADLIAFAASFGASQGDPIELEERAKQPDPIRREVFVTRGYESLIDLLAAYHLDDVRSLQSDDENIDRRIEIFEGYANAGLREMSSRLAPFGDKLEGLEFLLQDHKKRASPGEEGMDLSDLV